MVRIWHVFGMVLGWVWSDYRVRGGQEERGNDIMETKDQVMTD